MKPRPLLLALIACCAAPPAIAAQTRPAADALGALEFRSIGPGRSEKIGRMAIDPRNSDVVYVATQGPLWAAGGERGLYKTTDGGRTWKRILHVSEETGISDVVLDPRNPDLLYAASYQRRRHVGILIGGGPEGAIYRSTDA